MALLLLLGVALASSATAAVQCVTLAGGCDAGSAYDAAVSAAIAKFDINATYGVGASSGTIFSGAVADGALGAISYSCTNGSVPPARIGFDVRTL